MRHGQNKPTVVINLVVPAPTYPPRLQNVYQEYRDPRNVQPGGAAERQTCERNDSSTNHYRVENRNESGYVFELRHFPWTKRVELNRIVEKAFTLMTALGQ